MTEKQMELAKKLCQIWLDGYLEALEKGLGTRKLANFDICWISATEQMRNRFLSIAKKYV